MALFIAQIEIFPNSQIFCDRLSWVKAKHCVTASQYSRTLLTGVFDVPTLLQSSLKGRSNTRDKTADPKKPLDEESLRAIYSE